MIETEAERVERMIEEEIAARKKVGLWPPASTPDRPQEFGGEERAEGVES